MHANKWGFRCCAWRQAPADDSVFSVDALIKFGVVYFNNLQLQLSLLHGLAVCTPQTHAAVPRTCMRWPLTSYTRCMYTTICNIYTLQARDCQINLINKTKRTSSPMNACRRTRVHACTQTHARRRMHAHTDARMDACSRTHVCMQAHACMHACVPLNSISAKMSSASLSNSTSKSPRSGQ